MLLIVAKDAPGCQSVRVLYAVESTAQLKQHVLLCLSQARPPNLVVCLLLCMQVLLNVAKEAPGCFLPHLQSLVQQVEQLWAAGQLREGEKVSVELNSRLLLA